MLFRIAFMVDEKKLGPILSWLSEQKIVNMETPTPVKLADDRPYDEIVPLAGRDKISRGEIISALRAAGRSGTAVDYAIKQMTEAGKIKPNGKRGVYNVIKRNKGGK